MIVARKPKHKNYKTHLLSHECNEPLDQTGAELENLGHSVQVLLVSVRLLLQYHSIEVDIYIRKDQSAASGTKTTYQESTNYTINNANAKHQKHS